MQVSTNPPRIMNLGLLERWAFIAGGVALISGGMKKRSASGKIMALLGGGSLIYSGTSGYSGLWKSLGIRPRTSAKPAIPYQQGIRVDAAITIDKPREEVYSFWRKLENLPCFMQHLYSVTAIDQKRSHWVAQGPAATAEWDAEIINEQPNELIGWRSLPGSTVDTAGSVHFKSTADNRATDVQVELQYLPPAGVLGAAFAKLLGQDPADQIQEDLQRLKKVLEGTDSNAVVQEASEESFPASDAPSWIASGGGSTVP